MAKARSRLRCGRMWPDGVDEMDKMADTKPVEFPLSDPLCQSEACHVALINHQIINASSSMHHQ